MSNETYMVGELVSAQVLLPDGPGRVILTYVPDAGDDNIPWRRLAPSDSPYGGWFAADELVDVRRLVAVPVSALAKIRILLTDTRRDYEEAVAQDPESDRGLFGQDQAQAEAILALLGQQVQK